MSRVVVTGATGFLGQHLCVWLKALGYEVIGLGRDEARGKALKAKKIKFINCDLTRSIDLPGVSDIEAVVHAAALSSVWGPARAFEAANVTATQNLLDWAERVGVARFVFVSSPSVCFRFRDQLGVREDAPLPKPVTAYADTKARAEMLVRTRAALNPLILRPRGLYGPGDVALLPRLMRAVEAGPLPLLREGRAVTDLTHVEDVCRAISCALATRAAEGTYNISGGEALAVTEIIRRAAQKLDLTPKFKRVPVWAALTVARVAEGVHKLMPGSPEPPMTAYGIGVLAYSQTLDISAAKRDLGFVPMIGFEEGLERTFRMERSWGRA